jgi:hypothetical protein
MKQQLLTVLSFAAIRDLPWVSQVRTRGAFAVRESDAAAAPWAYP